MCVDRWSRHSARTVACALALSLVVGLVGCGSSNSSTERPKAAPAYAPSELVQGKSLGNWGAAWWQWALNIGADTNPILDTTGADCGEAQPGPVWFLAGNIGGAVERTCTIPSGKDVFFPILNDIGCVVPGDPNLDTVEKLGAALDAEFDTTTMSASLDGVGFANLISYRARSDVFTLSLSEGNLNGYPAVDIPDCIADGYLMILRPLSSGAHSLRFSGETPSTGFGLDVTYHLNVTP